jgi:hypothetical protein
MSSVRWKAFVRRTARVAAGLLVAYAISLGGMFWAMRQPPERFGKIMSHFPMPAMMAVPFEPMWNVARGGTVRVGDIAPDFTLPRADHTAEVTLSSFRGKQPVVLVFGSYT